MTRENAEKIAELLFQEAEDAAKKIHPDDLDCQNAFKLGWLSQSFARYLVDPKRTKVRLLKKYNQSFNE